MISSRHIRHLYRLTISPTAAAAKSALAPTLRSVSRVAIPSSSNRNWVRFCTTASSSSSSSSSSSDEKQESSKSAVELGDVDGAVDQPTVVDTEPVSEAETTLGTVAEVVVDRDDESASSVSQPADSSTSDSVEEDSLAESSSASPASESPVEEPVVDDSPSPPPIAEDPSSCPPPLPETDSSDTSSPPPIEVSSESPSPTSTSPTTTTTSASLHVHVLTDRALIRIGGADTQSLLQGLVTQDLALLDATPAVYAMMLNLQGRVLYDLIIYNVSSPRSEDQKYLLECDAAVAPDLISHLKKYKLRKSCDIADVSDIFEVSSARPTTERMVNVSSLPRKSEFAEAFDPILMACRDPRLKDIGWRLISGKGFDVSEALGGSPVARPLEEYREQRYKLGLAEGVADLEPGKSFPLESNLVFLNGVSFSKGCYLGQELTARTHHTGVIRKRIMPLILSTPISSELGPFPDNLILNTAGKDAGKFRAGVGEHAIGLIRVNMSGGRLIIVGKGRESECYAKMPHWWPVDDPAAVMGDEEDETVEEAAETTAQQQTSS